MPVFTNSRCVWHDFAMLYFETAIGYCFHYHIQQLIVILVLFFETTQIPGFSPTIYYRKQNDNQLAIGYHWLSSKLLFR